MLHRLRDRFADWLAEWRWQRAERRRLAHLRRLRKKRVVLDQAARVPDRFPTWRPYQ